MAIGGGSTIDIAKLAWLIYEQPDYNLGTFDNGIQDLKLRKKPHLLPYQQHLGAGPKQVLLQHLPETMRLRRPF